MHNNIANQRDRRSSMQQSHPMAVRFISHLRYQQKCRGACHLDVLAPFMSHGHDSWCVLPKDESGQIFRWVHPKLRFSKGIAPPNPYQSGLGISCSNFPGWIINQQFSRCEEWTILSRARSMASKKAPWKCCSLSWTAHFFHGLVMVWPGDAKASPLGSLCGYPPGN